jgi:iron(III) transport system substrate-binding protein
MGRSLAICPTFSRQRERIGLDRGCLRNWEIAIMTAGEKFLTGVAIAVSCLYAGATSAADLPKATQKIIAELKLAGSPFLEGMNEEASSAPAAVIEGAKKEKVLSISGSSQPEEYRKLIAPFAERYPFLKVTSEFGNNFARATKPLIAFKQGRVTFDIIEGAGEKLSDYIEAKALEKIDDVPNFAHVVPGYRDKEGYFSGFRLQYWCMTYNTSKLAESDLPATWDDLLAQKRFYNGKLALGNNPNTFMIMLWGAKGPEWSTQFMDKLFGQVKPQLRKEGPSALVGLVAAGELDIALPTAAYRTADYVEKGAPVSWHCPEPVPVSSSPTMILKGAPHPNAAKLYLNWLLSREGQIAQYYANGSPPVHKDLQVKTFISFPDQIVGRNLAIRTPELLHNEMPKVDKIWDAHWLAK